ncbi:hypothetical protein [Glaciecola sp. 1036]|uniref:hypothetical protein n=1 Tax=Alteromonadaceae TaxID=72275 RepID=UPI003CFE6C5F
MYTRNNQRGAFLRYYFLFVIALVSLSFTVFSQQKGIKYIAIGDVPNHTIQQVSSIVEANNERILTRYEIQNMPQVTIKIWQDRHSFEASYGDNAQFVQGYVVPKDWEARFFNGRPDIGLGVVHEYTHLVTLAINSQFNNNPRWLWEAIAIFESERPPVPKINTLKCLAEDVFPTLQNLEEHPFNIYKLGYYITDFILSTWDKQKLIELVKTNANLEAVLDVTTAEFESMWIDFLRHRYGMAFVENASQDC